MASLLRLLRSLGPAGAVANAKVLLDERRHEDLVVAAVARSLAPAPPARAPRPVMAAKPTPTRRAA